MCALVTGVQTVALPSLTDQAPAFVLFSTIAGIKGSFGLAREVRGFAVNIYTQEGNGDLVGNNIPVFFIQDAIKYPDVIHSVKPAPDREFPQAQSAHDNFWDFIRSEEHTSELQSLMRISYAVFCLKKNKTRVINKTNKINQYTRK